MTKRCSRCREVKDLTEFGRRTPRRVQSFCRVCQNSYSKDYYRQHKAAYISRANERHEEIKRTIRAAKDKPCADCGQKYPTYVMDFDHRVGEVKLFNLANVTSGQWRSLKTVVAEIAKCDVVCANCHRIRTHKRGQHSPKTQQRCNEVPEGL